MTTSALPPRRLGHLGGLDGLRGIAVLIVVASHLSLLVSRVDITGIGLMDGALEGGFLGVDIFFVLSGFLITTLLLQEQAENGRVRFGSFYARRALRLLPALYFMLLCHSFYALVTDFEWEAQATSVRYALLYGSNWQIVWDLFSVAPGTGHLWSLAIEEQFYLVWPVVLLGFLGLRRSATTVTFVLLGAIVIVAAHRARLWHQDPDWLTLFVRTDTRVDTLLVGALLGSLWVRRATPVRGVDPLAWVSLAVGAAYWITTSATESQYYLGGSTLFAIAVAGVILGMLNGTWGATAFFAARPLQAVGRVSYGLYLWHFPVFFAVARYGTTWSEWMRIVVAVTLAVWFTLVSWFFVERPLREFRSRMRPRMVPSPADARGAA